MDRERDEEMSKIEVLRVPDERIYTSDWYELVNELQDGDLVVMYAGDILEHIPQLWKPALLTALLEDAGAVKADIVRDDIACGLVVDLPADALGHRPQYEEGKILVKDVDRKAFWLFPVPEDTP